MKFTICLFVFTLTISFSQAKINSGEDELKKMLKDFNLCQTKEIKGFKSKKCIKEIERFVESKTTRLSARQKRVKYLSLKKFLQILEQENVSFYWFDKYESLVSKCLDVDIDNFSLEEYKGSKCDLPDTDHDFYLHGLGVERDLLKYKHCAQEKQDIEALSEIYANGIGVKKDPKRALQLICLRGGIAPADTLRMIKDLHKAVLENENLEFRFCDYQGSTMGLGMCGNRVSNIEKLREKIIFEKNMRKKWGEERYNTFVVLKEKYFKFTDELSTMIGYSCGCGMRGAYKYTAESKFNKEFLNIISSIEKKFFQKEKTSKTYSLKFKRYLIMMSKALEINWIDSAYFKRVIDTQNIANQALKNYFKKYHQNIDVEKVIEYFSTSYFNKLPLGDIKFNLGYDSSFRCEKASKSIEFAICSNKILSSLDRKLAKAYTRRFVKDNSIKVDQRLWLKKLKKCEGKSYIDCLTKEYTSRIEVLLRD